MINGRTRLHVVANGTMTGQRYIDEVLLPHVRLFRGAVGDKFVFMDDNATCHRTLAVRDCLDSEGIQRLVWPARSPDLNPIENVWDALGRQVAGRNYPPTNKNTLIRALTEEWDKLPQQLLDNVAQTLPMGIVCRHSSKYPLSSPPCDPGGQEASDSQKDRRQTEWPPPLSYQSLTNNIRTLRNPVTDRRFEIELLKTIRKHLHYREKTR
ncbi:transposable element Tc1 transposase [Trichonephila clavipes]|nr:transposable element Tc1 transposase [Trichonephila clavipes]